MQPTVQNATFFRRIAAMFYDLFILFSFMLMATAVALWVNGGQDLKSHQALFSSYILVSSGLFISWFWQRSGQTLGMLAWKIQVVNQDNQLLTWKKSLVRYFLAGMLLSLGGIGLLWCLFDKQKQSLYDRLLKTKIIKI